MQNSFSIVIGDTEFKINSMNVNMPGLFQLYVAVDGVKRRYHLHRNHSGDFEFALPDDVPKDIRNHQQQLSDGIKQHYGIL